MRSLKGFLALSTLLVPACGKDSSNDPKVPVLASPSASIPGGLGAVHKVTFRPEGSPEVQRGEAVAYSKMEGRRPVKIEILSAGSFEIGETGCDQDLCTLSYQQKQLAGAADIHIAYKLVDEAGHAWSPGYLTLDGQMPRFKPLAFQPIFGETIRINLPLFDQKGQPLREAPNVAETVATGGTIKSMNCTQEACALEFLYEKFQETPEITFRLENSVFKSTHTILPLPETVTITSRKQNVFGSPISVRLVQGVHYTSSWKRPAPSITILDAQGMPRVPFQCSSDSCISTFYLTNGRNAFMTWSIPGSTQRGRLDLNLAEADLKPLPLDVVVDSNEVATVTLKPGVDYTGTEGALANGIEFDYASVYGLTVDNTRCDANGVCTFNIRYSGSEPFVTRSFKLKLGLYHSPSQTLKITPRIVPAKTNVELWDLKEGYQEWVLEPGKDYQTQDGSKATAVVISSASLDFRDNPNLNDANRNQLFQCDDQGVCRAWVRKRAGSFAAVVSYSVQTTSGQSGYVSRSVVFKKDDIKILNPSQFAKQIGKTADQLLDRVEFSLQRGVDYQSAFPAEKLRVMASTKVLTLEGAAEGDAANREIPCDADGHCSLKGHFLAESGSLLIDVILVNSRGESNPLRMRLVREQNAFMMPNLYAIKLEKNGSEEFEITFRQGDRKGYDGEILARRVQVQSSDRKLLSGTSVAGSSFREYPCAEDGSCTFRIRGGNQDANLKYRFLDDAGHVSYLNDLSVAYPELFASSMSASVPAEVGTVKFNIPIAKYDPKLQLVLDLPAGMKARTDRRYSYFEVQLTLDQPLVAKQQVSLPFSISLDGQRSNVATLTLEPYQPLALKPDLVVPAQKQSDGTWSFTLQYADHFRALTEPAFAPYYFNQHMILKLQSHPDILPPTISCNFRDSCTWNFVKVEGSPLKQITASLSYERIYTYDLYHLKEGTLTITF